MNPISQKVKTLDLAPNPWNTNIVSPDNQIKIEESIKRFGLFKPIIVRTLSDGTLEILGGQHRWEAAKSLEIPEVNIVNLGEIDEKKAKEISLIDNGRYGADDSLRLSALLKELGDDISTFMPYTNEELDQIFGSAQIDLDALDFDDTEDEVEETIEELVAKAPTYQVMRFKVPIGDAGFVQGIIDGIAEAQGFEGSDSLTNAGDALVWLCRRKQDDA